MELIHSSTKKCLLLGSFYGKPDASPASSATLRRRIRRWKIARREIGPPDPNGVTRRARLAGSIRCRPFQCLSSPRQATNPAAKNMQMEEAMEGREGGRQCS